MSRYIDRAELFNRLSSVKTLAEAYAVIQDMPAEEPLTAADLLELEHRFGLDVREVVEDMLKGEGKRWQST